MQSGVAYVGGEAKWHDTLSAFAEHLHGLHQRCQSAYHAFDALPSLVDQLRILSVNAELASARAGDYGRAVRVLTHFATESVTRLLGVVPQMVGLKKRTYALAGSVMRAAAEIRSLEAAGRRVLLAGHTFPEGAEDPLTILDRAHRRRLHDLTDAVAKMTVAHGQLIETVRSVRQVMMQAEIISANIAIEATSAGPHQADLQAIADIMRERVVQLRTMIDEAARALRDAAHTNIALAGIGRA